MSVKAFVVAALLLSSTALLASGDDDCDDGSKNPNCTCRNLSSTEANLFNTNTFCSQPKYHTPPAFPEFTDQQPISKIRDLNSEDPVTLSCQISSQNAASFSIIWEHNNVPISNNSSTYSSVYNDRDGSSTLTIRRPSLVESEGRYRCRVDYQYDSNGNFSLVSREAHFETPRFSGWVDSVSGNTTPIMSNTTLLSVQEGESFVLECNPHTNDPSMSDVSAVWTRNHVLIDSGDSEVVFLGERNSTLLVRNFSYAALGAGSESMNVTFRCLLSGLRYLKELERTFVITPVKGKAPQDFLLPQNQTVLPGKAVTLYCLSKPDSSLNGSNTWLFKNVTIDQVSHSNHYDIVDEGRVLVIRSVSMETSGVYTCRMASGEEYSAVVEVLGNVFITSTTHNFTSNYQIGIGTEVSAAATNHTISLSCHTGSRLDANDHSDLLFEWFFRGSPIQSSSFSSSLSNSRSQNRAAIAFIKRENSLMMISEDPWQLIGTVQCLVSVASPIGDDQLHEVKSASVHILARGKPNPPCMITVDRSFNMEWPFNYQLGYHNANCGPPQAVGTTYVTEILIQNDSKRKLCTCEKKYNYLNFDTTEESLQLLKPYEKNMSFRVALSVGGVLSDFLPYVNRTTNSCEVPLIIDRAPPKPTFHGPPRFNLSSHTPYPVWNVTQEWNTTDECIYPSRLYSTYTSISCLGHTEYNGNRTAVLKSVRKEFSYTIPCRTTCSLTVSAEVYTSNTFYTSSTTTITTPQIAPIRPPTLYDVRSVNETSFDVYVTVLNEAIYCVEDRPSLVVNYSTPGGIPSTQFINISNCDSPSTSGDSTSFNMSYVCHVTDSDSCLDGHMYEVIVAYQSVIDGEERISDYSDALLLQGPSEESILAGIQSMNIITTSTNELTVNFNISENISCIVQREQLITAHICLTNTTCETADHELDLINCKNRSVDESAVFQDLLPDQTYCIRADISYGVATRVLPDHSVHTGAITTSTAEGSIKPTTSGLNQDETLLKAVVGASLGGVVAVLCAIVVCISFMCCYYYRRMKFMNYHRLNDNESIISRDPVDPAERAESVHSERTDPEFMVRRLLKDVEGQPDGGEDPTILCEDYTGPHGDGEFEDIERESLQGFGDAEEMVEKETSSSVNSSSLEDRQKMKTMLSNIQKENQAYQALKQPVMAVELSPLRAPPSLLTSLPSNGMSLSGDQRTVPDGYVEDLNVNARSEGFHNPVQLSQQQPLTPASHDYRSLGSASSSPALQPSRDRNQTAMMRTLPTSAAPSSGGYVQSPQLPGMQVITQVPFTGSDNLIDLSSNNEQVSLGPHNLSAGGYIVQDPTSVSVGGEREERGPSAESGNEEDDSLSNEGDSNSVFDDELIASENPIHSMRPRSTVTSGFQSGSSESANSPEPPNKSTSSISSLAISPLSTVLPPSTHNIHAPSLAKKDDDISPCLTNFSLLQTSSNSLSSDSFPPHTPHSHSSASSNPPAPVTFISPAYRPLSTGGSSGYVTNDSSRSDTYHSSSATSQTSGLAPTEFEREFNVEGVESHDGQKYTIPSLLSCTSKSSSPAVSRATNGTSMIQTDSANKTYLPHFPNHHQAANATMMDYVNTSDVDLSKISTELGELSQSNDRVTTGHQDVSFVFPISSK